jgi:quercetin dioxygenase-like cupin family protein
MQSAVVIAFGYGIQAYSAFLIDLLLREHQVTASRRLHRGASIRTRRNRGDIDMLNRLQGSLMIRRGLCATALMLGAALAAPASAGECPTNKVKAGARNQGETQPKDVTDTTLASIDLSKEKVNLQDRQMRIRRLVVQPGGVVPWHSHEDRPALIYIVSGTIEEYASNCSVPIVHKAGEVSVEKLGVQHWWKNTGKAPAVLLSSDVFHEMRKEDEHMM